MKCTAEECRDVEEWGFYDFKSGLSLFTQRRRQDFPDRGNRPLWRMELQSRGPCFLTYSMSTWSSSAIHGPLRSGGGAVEGRGGAVEEAEYLRPISSLCSWGFLCDLHPAPTSSGGYYPRDHSNPTTSSINAHTPSMRRGTCAFHKPTGLLHAPSLPIPTERSARTPRLWGHRSSLVDVFICSMGSEPYHDYVKLLSELAHLRILTVCPATLMEIPLPVTKILPAMHDVYA